MGLDYKFGRGVSDDKASWFVLLSLKENDKTYVGTDGYWK